MRPAPVQLPADPVSPVEPRGPVERGVPFVARLGEHGDRPALLSADEEISYAELARRVLRLADELGPVRRLVLVSGRNRVDAVVGYLAALAGRHPVILAPGDNPAALAAIREAYDPDVLLDGTRVTEVRPGTLHELHPDLALLLSTSGSTGSPKLVRLSTENLHSNAEAIADYLAIRPSDVAAATLPVHYCYGLSVLHSHLLAGASVLLTEHSVVDACFWELFTRHRATSLAGVPYTFDLLDRIGFADLDLPHLRYVTQAGGRLAPEAVRRYAELGRRRGWDLFVMYGQTEATARMGYLPPDLALEAPSAVGVAVPGGSFTIEPVPDPSSGAAAGPAEVGELVYEGPNVMLGYAETPADLAAGRTVARLHTGDLARRTADGLVEIVGRRSRFAKVFGLRIDLDQVERLLAGAGVYAACTDGSDAAGTDTSCAGGRIVVAVETGARPVDADAVHRLLRQRVGVPAGAVRLVAVTRLPRLASGKPDYPAVTALAEDSDRAAATRPSRRTESGTVGTRASAAAGTDAALHRLFGQVLRRDDVTDEDTFVSLDGDSLSYVEMSLRLEQALGHLPVGWHVTPIGELARRAPDRRRSEVARRAPRRRRTVSLETNVLLRAVAIVLIVGSHANLYALPGGAHVLLGVAGFNFGRFHLTGGPRRDRVRHLLVSVARIVVPSVLWIGFAAAVLTPYTWQNVLLLNAALGPPGWAEPQWHYWFIEALVYTLLALTVLAAVPALDRLERRHRFAVPMTLVLVGLLTRYRLVEVAGGDAIHRASVVFWLFALGWAAVTATTRRQRLLVSAVLVVSVPGFFGDLQREAIVVAGMLALVWLPAVRLPAAVARVVGVLAGASLYIYLTHWQVYPHLEDRFPLLATLLSLAVGVLAWRLVTRLPAYLRRPRRLSGHQIGHSLK